MEAGMRLMKRQERMLQKRGIGGWAGQLMAGWLGRLRRGEPSAPRLTLVERIALAPRHSLALVEAEGQRFLVAIPADGSPAFLALGKKAGSGAGARGNGPVRVSW